MPFSSGAFDHWVGTLFDLLQPKAILDIGPGAGKYGRVAQESAVRGSFACRTTAIEIDEGYILTYKLRDLYDEVIVGDAMPTLLKMPRSRFDLVMIGDCIEHMRKSDGIDLLNFLIYRAGYICIIYPERFLQDDWDGHAAEAHISTWSENDFRGWDVIHHFWSGMHMFLIDGYQPTRLKVTG
jgi:SAM-dependent methyltransferase